MQFPSWLTWYKKPEYRDIREYANAVGSGRRSFSPDGRGKTAIPSRLKLERVLENKTCSPMSLYDFYMYLKYIEFSAENLEFYIWFRNYEKAWSKIGVVDEKDDQSLSSKSSIAKPGDDITEVADAAAYVNDPELARETLTRITQLISSDAVCTAAKCSTRKFNTPRPTYDPSKPLPAAGAAVGSKWATSTLHLSSDSIPTTGAVVGPRAELNAIIETFILPGSEKELNIPPSMRQAALSALRTSSDPVHLKPIAEHAYSLLRNCSHRNFVRLGVSNGTFETVCVATSLGIVLTLAGFLVVLLRALTPHIGAHSRFDAFASWPFWWLGVSLILSGLRGSCFFLLLFSRRQPLPWERFDDSASTQSTRSGLLRKVSRLMIFDRKLMVNDAHLRALQHKIVVQSLIGGALFANFGVLFFIFLPIWQQTVRH